jgi:hypothetical protein
MRLKRKFLALIVVIMLVITTLVASMMVQYTQGGRIAYVGVRTDKSVYSDGEDVTFKFVPLTTGVYFSTSGRYQDLYEGTYYQGDPNYHAVMIVKIPDGYSPDQVIGQKNLNSIYSWNSGANMGTGFDYFNSTDGPLSLRWNATVMKQSYDTYNGTVTTTYIKATGGYYIILPSFKSMAGHPVSFQLDRSAIFYIDALKVSAVPSLIGTSFTFNMRVSAPSNFTGTSHCTMSWSLNGPMDTSGGSIQGIDSFDLVPEGEHRLNITAETYTGMYGQNQFGVSGYVQSSWGNYSFNVFKYLNDGRWSDSSYYGYYYA